MAGRHGDPGRGAMEEDHQVLDTILDLVVTFMPLSTIQSPALAPLAEVQHHLQQPGSPGPAPMQVPLVAGPPAWVPPPLSQTPFGL